MEKLELPSIAPDLINGPTIVGQQGALALREAAGGSRTVEVAVAVQHYTNGS
jgi:hypothetical protein